MTFVGERSTASHDNVKGMVCVVGEALIDLTGSAAEGAVASTDGSVRYVGRPGGSPYNVAIGLARLGQPVQLLARLASDPFGRQLRAHAGANGVDLSLAVTAAERTTLAVVSVDEQDAASYTFYGCGTADWQWTAAELDRLPDGPGWVHVGSLASWLEPGATLIEAQLRRRRPAPGLVISYDPNVRPGLMPDHAHAVAQVERLVALSDVVKASSEDAAWLYPGEGLDDVLRRWRRLGPRLAVITDGERGALALCSGAPALSSGAPARCGDTDGADVLVRPARPARVVDTVGAGDAFMAGLIDALARGDVLGRPVTVETAGPALDQAILAAALTCDRAGADPPTAAELAAAR